MKIYIIIIKRHRDAKFYRPHFCVKTLYTLSVNRPFLLPYFWDKKEYRTCSCLRMLSSFALVNLNVHILIEFLEIQLQWLMFCQHPPLFFVWVCVIRTRLELIVSSPRNALNTYLSTLNAGISIMVHQVKFMKFLMKMVNYFMSSFMLSNLIFLSMDK